MKLVAVCSKTREALRAETQRINKNVFKLLKNSCARLCWRHFRAEVFQRVEKAEHELLVLFGAVADPLSVPLTKKDALPFPVVQIKRINHIFVLKGEDLSLAGSAVAVVLSSDIVHDLICQ